MPTTTQRKILNISLPVQFYSEVEKIAEQENKTKAELARDALRRYIESGKRWQEIRKIGRATAKKYGIKNDDDIERIVDEVRCSK